MENLIKQLENLPYYSGNNLEKQVNNILVKNNIKFYYQPNGIQKFPDFYLIDYDLNLECKSSHNTKPMWNCSYPKLESLYVISSKKLNKTIVMFGKEIVTQDVIDIYEEYQQKHKELVMNLNEKLLNLDNNKYKMKIFARNMFTQNIGFSCETNTLCKTIDDYTREYQPKNNGQYFTISKEIQEKLLNDYTSTPNNILEPSCGIGHLLQLVYKKFSNITAIDIDNDVLNISEKLFPLIDYKCCDFLTTNIEKKYDLIIANPPYFEILKKNVPEEYKEICSGRVNIYYLFLYKCINLLSDNGELRFIIPKSFLSNKYAEKLRKFLISKCIIIDIEFFQSDKCFENASQNVIILKCKRGNGNSKHVLSINDSLFFVPNNNLEITNKTIQTLNCQVKTGNIIWNEHKNKLVDNPTNNLKLYYASELNSLKKSTEKKSYMLKTPKTIASTITGPCILVQRIFSKNLVCKYITNIDENFLVENHINIITGEKAMLDIIYKSLLDPRTTNFIQTVFNSTQISKTELQNILPIYE